MNRYTFGEALPLPGASAALLTAAVERSHHPTTLTDLAKTAGISKFAASRSAQTLLQADLLTSDDEGYALNPNHPMATTIERLAWRFSGVRRRDTGTRWHGTERRPKEDYHYQRTVPKSLQLGATISPDLMEATGPDLVTARDTCDWLAEKSHVLREFEHDGQEVYSLWSNERLRDLVHQTLHLCGAVGAAHETLTAACGSTTQGDSNPFEVRVSAYSWVRATYLLSAEARDVLRVINLLDQAIWVGHQVHQLRSEALWGLDNINHSGPDSEFVHEWLLEALDAEGEAVRLWNDHSFGTWHHMGGTPQPQDVGTAGDQIMAVRLLRIARELAAQVATMSRASCVQDWISANPGQADALPLIHDVSDEELRGRRDWPAWPPTPKYRRARVTDKATDTKE